MKPKPNENRDLIPGYIDAYRLCGYRATHFRPGMVADGTYRTAIQGDGAGFPDIFAVKEKPPRLISTTEVKVPGGKQSPAQIDWGRVLTGTPGVIHHVGYGDYQELIDILRPRLDKPIDPLQRCFNILDKLERANPGNLHLITLRDWMEKIPGAQGG